MVTLCTSQAVLDRIGPYANSDVLASEAIIDRYIEDAEQTIVSETRTNWIDDHASVSTALQSTLQICTACHAAVDIISDDMGGFPTKAEAITLLNVNENRFKRTLKALENRNSQDIRSVE